MMSLTRLRRAFCVIGLAFCLTHKFPNKHPTDAEVVKTTSTSRSNRPDASLLQTFNTKPTRPRTTDNRPLESRFCARRRGESQLKSSGLPAHSDPKTKRPGHSPRSNHLRNRPLGKNLAASQY